VPEGLLGRCLLVVAVVCGIAVVPAMVISAYVGYYMLVPRYTAVAEFDDRGFNLRLEFYLTDPEASVSGRYLSVISGGSYKTQRLEGWDWSHRARTSVYLIDPTHIAVLSALGYDYEIGLAPVGFVPLVPDHAERWQYLGAFDFTFLPDGRPRLQFFDAKLAECIPMGSSDPATWATMPRLAARRPTCPNPPQF